MATQELLCYPIIDVKKGVTAFAYDKMTSTCSVAKNTCMRPEGGEVQAVKMANIAGGKIFGKSIKSNIKRGLTLDCSVIPWVLL